MKIIVTGSLGHISKPLAAQLVENGHEVTVISSSTDRQKDIEALGATAAIGSLEDGAFLAATFSGADAVYTMVPPNGYFEPGFDLEKYIYAIANNYVQAIQQSGVKRVVHLSSIGAHMDKDSGLILYHHNVEVMLGQLPQDVAITFMRPAGFYYNLFAFIGMIKSQGVIASNYGEDDAVVWVAPADIATAIAEEFETQAEGRKVRYVASQELTCNATAKILGEAIGKPDLQWIIIPDEQLKNGLIAAGMQPRIAADMVQMYASTHKGELQADYFKHRPALGKIKLAEFAKDFAAAYHQQQ